MFPADRLPQPVTIEHDEPSIGSKHVVNGQIVPKRTRTTWPNAWQAKMHYVDLDKQGRNPKVIGAKAMCPEVETQVSETTPAAKAPKAKKSPAKKGSAKKAPAKAPKTEKKSTPRGPSIRLRVFQLLKKHPNGLTGAAIAEKLELSGIPSLLKDEGLAEKPRIRRTTDEQVRGVLYVLTAAGKTAVDKDTVDSGAAPRTSGEAWPNGK